MIAGYFLKWALKLSEWGILSLPRAGEYLFTSRTGSGSDVTRQATVFRHIQRYSRPFKIVPQENAVNCLLARLAAELLKKRARKGGRGRNARRRYKGEMFREPRMPMMRNDHEMIHEVRRFNLIGFWGNRLSSWFMLTCFLFVARSLFLAFSVFSFSARSFCLRSHHPSLFIITLQGLYSPATGVNPGGGGYIPHVSGNPRLLGWVDGL